MSSYFDALFHEYCELEKPKRKMQLFKRTEEIVALVFSCAIFILSLLMIVLHHESGDIVFIGLLIILCTVAVVTRILLIRNSIPNVQQYTEHISQVVKKLEKYGIRIGEPEDVQKLINYTSEVMNKRNPLSDIKKSLTIAGSVIVAVWSVLSNGLNESAELSEYVNMLVKVAGVSVAFCILLMIACNIVEYMVYPAEKKYKELIDDLKQISIFSSKIHDASQGELIEQQ